jgi:hypothetical protein
VRKAQNTLFLAPRLSRPWAGRVPTVHSEVT